MAIRVEHRAPRTHGLNLQPTPPEQPGAALPPLDRPNNPALQIKQGTVPVKEAAATRGPKTVSYLSAEKVLVQI